MSFWDTITEWLEPAWDFVMGTEEWESGDLVGYTGGIRGFLDPAADFFASDARMAEFLKSGAQAYLSGAGTPQQQQQRAGIRVPDIGSAPSPASAAMSSARNPVGLSNPDIQSAIRNLAGGKAVNPKMQEITRPFMTAQQGRRTIGTASPAMPRVSPTAAATVRTAAKEVDLT